MPPPDTTEPRPEDAPDPDLRVTDSADTMAGTPSGEAPLPKAPSDVPPDAPPADCAAADPAPETQEPLETVTPAVTGPRDEGREDAADRPSAASLFTAAAVTGGWAGVVSFAPLLAVVLLGWFGSSEVSASTAVRFAVNVWLLAHGVPFGADGVRLGLVPLAFTVLVVWRLVRAGAYTARAVAAVPGDVPRVAGALALTHGVLGFFAALVASSGAFTSAPVPGGLVLAGVAALAGTAGALRETGAAAQLWQRWPEQVREGVRGGVLATLSLLSVGAALAGVATVLAYDDAVDLYRGYQVGVAGGAGITLVGLAYAPNLAIWGVSYLAGPGFAVGAGSHVTIFDVSLGPLPAVPVLAGLPTDSAPAVFGLLLAAPILAGMVTGVPAARRDPELAWRPLLFGAVLPGPVAGALLAALSFASSGPLGVDRMVQVGPTWWTVGLVVAVLVSAGGLLGAVSARLIDARR